MKVYAELHCHTSFSDGWATPEACVRMAGSRGIQILAITDHNTAEGALPYWKKPIQNGVLIVPGEEISTDRGHVLAFFVRDSISPGPFEKVLLCIHEQNALPFMAHPFHIPLGNRWRKQPLCNLRPEHITQLTGIEIYNGHNREQANILAMKFARDKRLSSISGSDAHLPWEIGNAMTEFDLPALTLEAVRTSLSTGQVKAIPRHFNAFAIYLLVGVMNRLTSCRYDWGEG